MIDNAFKLYEGTAKYIFISYSHRNIPVVYDIMEKLNSAGFRMWYDNGIPLTKDYADIIAQHINNCEVVIVFHSPEHATSDFCQNEIHYACNLGKQILQIFIQPTTLSPGIQLRLNRYQSINFYDFANSKNFSEFYKKIFAVEVLQTCRSNDNPENMYTWGLNYARAYEKETDPIKKASLRQTAIYYFEKVLSSNWVFKNFVKDEFELLTRKSLYEINEQTVDKVYQHALNYIHDCSITSNVLERYIKLYDAKWILQKIADSDFSLKYSAKEKLDAINAKESARKATFQELISRR